MCVAKWIRRLDIDRQTVVIVVCLIWIAGFTYFVVVGHLPWDRGFMPSNSPFADMLPTCNEVSQSLPEWQKTHIASYEVNQRRYKSDDRPFLPDSARRLCFGHRFRLEMLINEMPSEQTAQDSFHRTWYCLDDGLDCNRFKPMEHDQCCIGFSSWGDVSAIAVDEYGVWQHLAYSPIELELKYEDVIDGPVYEAAVRARVGRTVFEVNAVDADPWLEWNAEDTGYVFSPVRWHQVFSTLDTMLTRWSLESGQR